MKTLYLHVGLPRCASTLIENVFFQPLYSPYHRLKAAGIEPLRRLKADLRRIFAMPTISDEVCQKLYDFHLRPRLNDKNRGFFVSDEALTAFDYLKGAKTVFADRAQFVGKLTEGFDAKVILFVRNQVATVESYYGLSLQNHGTMPFQAFYDQFPFENLDWLPVADAFASVVGEENIIVLPFERSAYTEKVPFSDFFNALFQIMGVDNPVSLSEMPVANRSLDPYLFPAQIRVNKELDEKTAKIVHLILYETYPKKPGSPMNLLTADQENELRERFRQSNETLFDRYMPDFDSSLYLPR